MHRSRIRKVSATDWSLIPCKHFTLSVSVSHLHSQSSWNTSCVLSWNSSCFKIVILLSIPLKYQLAAFESLNLIHFHFSALPGWLIIHGLSVSRFVLSLLVLVLLAAFAVFIGVVMCTVGSHTMMLVGRCKNIVTSQCGCTKSKPPRSSSASSRTKRIPNVHVDADAAFGAPAAPSTRLRLFVWTARLSGEACGV